MAIGILVLAFGSVVSLADILWVVAFRRGRFASSLDHAFWKENYLQRSILLNPCLALLWLGITAVVASDTSLKNVPAALVPVAVLGIASLGVGVVGAIWGVLSILVGIHLPKWFIPAWARDTICQERLEGAAKRRRPASMFGRGRMSYGNSNRKRGA